MQEIKAGRFKGIDVSHWQPLIDWGKVKKEGIAFAYLKATEGCCFTDLMFKKYYHDARLLEIKTGFYHFARFTNCKEAEQEAHYFIQAVKNYPVDLPYVLDLEVCPLKMERRALSSAARYFLETVKTELRNPVMIQTNTAFAREHLDSSLSVYPLWIAHYGVVKPEENGIWENWALFQYTNKGKIKGIVGPVDMNVMDQDVFSLKRSQKQGMPFNMKGNACLTVKNLHHELPGSLSRLKSRFSPFN